MGGDKVDPKTIPQILRSTILTATFDGQPTIWCPLGEFFGTGARPNEVHDFNRVAYSGESIDLCSCWVMPYQHTAKFSLINLGTAPVNLNFSTNISPFTWDDRSMHFHANWHCTLGLKTRPMSDWNFLQATGQGVYVGDTLTVLSPVKAWYGEGDERIYIDGEKVASHIGTGTEDYYGFAWGMPNFFNSPFISCPRRDKDARDDWRGYTTTSRLRLLDAIPFRKSLQQDMEIWDWADTKVDYAAATFWYARLGAQDNYIPQDQEAKTPLHDTPQDFKIPGAFECETLPITAQSTNLRTEIQANALRQGEWSNGKQLFVHAAKSGDFIELQISAPDNLPHKITLYATKSYDYGILHFTINGQPTGQDYDAYDHAPVASGPIDLGTAEPKDGKFTLRVTVTGSNPAAKGTRSYFGLDCIVLSKP